MRVRTFGMIAACLLASSFVGTAGAEPPRMTTAPARIIRNPTAPPPPIHNPEPRRGRQRPRDQFTALEFIVWTAGDDLRERSDAYVYLNYPDGTSQICSIHSPGDDGWANNSRHQAPHQCILVGPKTWAQLRAIKLVLQMQSVSHMTDYFQSSDNWDVMEVRVNAIDPVEKQHRCLLDADGDPYLVRLTNDQKSYDLTEAENHC